MTKPISIVWTIAIALSPFVYSTYVWATEVKTLECENYVTGADGLKDKRSIFSIIHLVEANKVEIKVKRNDNSWHPPEGDDWRVIWKSDDNLHVVATLIRRPAQGALLSPVLLLDVDYENVRYKEVTLGGPTDFSEIISSPWKRECRRSD